MSPGLIGYIYRRVAEIWGSNVRRLGAQIGANFLSFLNTNSGVHYLPVVVYIVFMGDVFPSLFLLGWVSRFRGLFFCLFPKNHRAVRLQRNVQNHLLKVSISIQYYTLRIKEISPPLNSTQTQVIPFLSCLVSNIQLLPHPQNVLHLTQMWN